MSDTMKQTMVDIADKYCELYGVTRYDLFQKGKHKNAVAKRIINKVNVSYLRMALGYYFTNNFPVTLTEIAGLIGYNDHTTISFNNQRIYFYIKNKDEKFMKYYVVLEEIAKQYPFYTIVRHKQQFITLN